MDTKNLELQHSEFMHYIDTYLFDRADSLKKMYDSFGNRLVLAPASSVEHYHNAFVGGYIDHVLRVIDFSLKMYSFYEQTNQDLTGFTKANLVFVAMNHDLGKLGFIGEGREKYIPNDSDWHRKNMGKIYKTNDSITFLICNSWCCSRCHCGRSCWGGCCWCWSNSWSPCWCTTKIYTYRTESINR